ncbi:sugar/nucleoside kinase (ribokinase family) [Rhodopseudomonas julia]|uniref:Sugar/nucleoside kinase (Ribokinase family) n=1 Tax=Rhodopseudomonas julia TaxID=200617 RepID=A0ABU0C7P8_9BRAD|nr:sugar kinase [Rhodopseudomonas julia]MDQ0326530.1 sugar/nucleoside kinase (ribokinase family) [Rhodopseudomonas julia]
MKKIVTIGEVLVEIMAEERGNGFLEPITLVGPFPSGAPAIFIDQVAKLGQPCGIISAVGPDDFGAVNLERLKADGVDVSAIAVIPDAVTGSAFVRYREDGNRNFIFNIRQSACGQVSLDQGVEKMLGEADHLHVMGSSLFSDKIISLIRTAVERVKAKGGSVSFDPNIRKEMLDFPGMREALVHIFENADIFLPSGDELFLFTEAKEEEAAIAEILTRGTKAVVIKRGAEGASYFDASGETRVPAFSVEEIDPTGAGDSFGATFVTFWLRGVSSGDALLMANASGARAVGVKGPMSGTSTGAELEDFIARHKGERA